MVIGAAVLRGESVGCRSGFQHCLLEAHSLRSLAVIGDGLVPVGVEQVIDLAGVLVGRALHDFVIMAVHGDHGAAALEVDAGCLTRIHEVETVASSDRDFLGLLRDGGGGQGRLIEPTIIDLIVGVAVTVAQLLEDQHGVRQVLQVEVHDAGVASELPTPDWVVMNGNRVQVKRKAFERFIDSTDVI